MLNVRKTLALAIIALLIGLIAYSTATSITPSTSATNGTNFTFNLSGRPAMPNFTTFDCGVNMTCLQNSSSDNHTIFIDSLGAGGGAELDPLSVHTDNNSLVLRNGTWSRQNTSINTVFNLSGNKLLNVGDIMAVDDITSTKKQIVSYQAWDVGSSVNFFSNNRKYNKSTFSWEFMDYPLRGAGSFILFDRFFIITTFPPNSTVDTRLIESDVDATMFTIHVNTTVDTNLSIGKNLSIGIQKRGTANVVCIDTVTNLTYRGTIDLSTGLCK